MRCVPYRRDPNAKFTPHTLSIVVENRPGVLDVITGTFARRGYNIQSLGVGPERTFDISRISTVVPGTYDDVEKLLKQILKAGRSADCLSDTTTLYPYGYPCDDPCEYLGVYACGPVGGCRT